MKTNKSIFICILIVVVTCSANNVYGDNSIKIEGVKVINQHPELPTGCEATALTMLLNYYGVKVSKGEVAKKIPMVKLPYYINGKKYGSHPNDGFVGNPFSRHSYGVFAKPIVSTIEKYLPGRSEDLTGETFDKILSVVKSGRPVMIWATIGMSNVSYTQSWYLSSGEKFYWPNNEHALVVVGYDDKYVYVNDPYTGGQRKFARNVVINRYNSLGRQAVAILPEDINMNVVIDGEKVDLPKSVIKSKDKIMFPLVYLSNIGVNAEYYYDNQVIYLNIEGIQEDIQMKGKTGTSIVNTNENQKVEIDYSIKSGITRIGLQDLVKLGTFNYKVDKNTITITTILNEIKSEIDNTIEEDVTSSNEDLNNDIYNSIDKSQEHIVISEDKLENESINTEDEFKEDINDSVN